MVSRLLAYKTWHKLAFRLITHNYHRVGMALASIRLATLVPSPIHYNVPNAPYRWHFTHQRGHSHTIKLLFTYNHRVGLTDGRKGRPYAGAGVIWNIGKCWGTCYVGLTDERKGRPYAGTGVIWRLVTYHQFLFIHNHRVGMGLAPIRLATPVSSPIYPQLSIYPSNVPYSIIGDLHYERGQEEYKHNTFFTIYTGFHIQ